MPVLGMIFLRHKEAAVLAAKIQRNFEELGI
jgi:hypothetical protein